MKVDLHCHSTNSDGTWSVRQILEEAEAKKVDVLAISDHDNIKGSKEAFALKDGLFSGELIAAIEISTSIEGNKVHFLAYFPTVQLPYEADLLANLDKIQNNRIWRMKEMIKKAQALGFDISFSDVLQEAGTGIEGDTQPTDVLSRPHLARVLIKKGYVDDFDEAFDKYLADGKPIHVNRFSLEFHEWIEQVKELNGLIIWAHPLQGHNESREGFLQLAKILADSDIDGVERIYNYKGKYTIPDEFEQWGERELDRLIAQHNWLITAGGDFHGNVGVIGELDLPKKEWHKFWDRLFAN